MFSAAPKPEEDLGIHKNTPSNKGIQIFHEIQVSKIFHFFDRKCHKKSANGM